MDWYEQMFERCVDNHDPAEWDGREWEDLTDKEREESLSDGIADLADALEVM